MVKKKWIPQCKTCCVILLLKLRRQNVQSGFIYIIVYVSTLNKAIISFYICTAIKFLSSGREDVDVRNIYGGRPFAVELLNPRMTNITNELLEHLAAKINQSTKQVQITSGLKVLSRYIKAILIFY